MKRARKEFYRTSPIKHKAHRTAAEMADMLAAIHEILDGEEGQITIRHLFYRVASELGVNSENRAKLQKPLRPSGEVAALGRNSVFGVR